MGPTREERMERKKERTRTRRAKRLLPDEVVCVIEAVLGEGCAGDLTNAAKTRDGLVLRGQGILERFTDEIGLLLRICFRVGRGGGWIDGWMDGWMRWRR